MVHWGFRAFPSHSSQDGFMEMHVECDWLTAGSFFSESVLLLVIRSVYLKIHKVTLVKFKATSEMHPLFFLLVFSKQESKVNRNV